MREYSIEAKNIKKPIYPAVLDMKGVNGREDVLSFNNYFMQMNGEPFYAVCGEAHFSRMDENAWEDEIVKMKMGGLNVISTYIIWIHHEEIEGRFDWSGNKNLHGFVELCRKHHMFVILRIGPFCHGEVRNGGFPDWLFGRPFDLRSNDEEYLRYAQILFSQIGQQVEGLLYKDGGPIIGTQIENEHQHASAPWEMTTENSIEWMSGGKDGAAHIIRLKELARLSGIDTPLYTATAWGGASAPIEHVFPLWGGYAFRPWIFYGDVSEHPATTEYIFGDYHNNEAPEYDNFDPSYPREDIPFACCEMGGGMSVFYKYRFKLPYESVPAMAGVKAASGCNFLGYYMFHGGTNPKGKRVPYLNENALPKISYDYQAAIGEFGQLRDSYKMLKLQHLFYEDFADVFCATKTVLSEESRHMDPHDVETLRYALRIGEASQGFVFINNYQDHVCTITQKDFAITLELDHEALRIPARGCMNLERDCFAILPFNFRMGDVVLKYATAQLITMVENTYFFFTPGGMSGEFCFDNGSGADITASDAEIDTGAATTTVKFNSDKTNVITIKGKAGGLVRICVLTEPESRNLWKFQLDGLDRVVISKAAVLPKGGSVFFEYTGVEKDTVKVFPASGKTITAQNKSYACKGSDGVFDSYDIAVGPATIEVDAVDAGIKNEGGAAGLRSAASAEAENARAVIRFDEKMFEGVKQLLLNVDYVGDIGYAFIDGELVHDNFCNGAVWEIGLIENRARLLEKGMYIYISPRKTGGYIKSDSSMAARYEVVDEKIAGIHSIWAVPVYEFQVEL